MRRKVARVKAEARERIGRHKGRTAKGAKGAGSPPWPTAGSPAYGPPRVAYVPTACQAWRLSRRRMRADNTRVAAALCVTFPCLSAGCCPHVPTHRVPLALVGLGNRTRTTSLGSRVRARSSKPECHGLYDWRFPRYCNSGAPKALEHCDGQADGSRRIRWLGGACESRALEEHRERNKRRNRKRGTATGSEGEAHHG